MIILIKKFKFDRTVQTSVHEIVKILYTNIKTHAFCLGHLGNTQVTWLSVSLCPLTYDVKINACSIVYSFGCNYVGIERSLVTCTAIPQARHGTYIHLYHLTCNAVWHVSTCFVKCVQSQVCQGPISWRVQSAGRVLAETSPKDVTTVLRTLVQSVFGAAGPAEPGVLGWGLQLFTKSQHPTEYQQLMAFLSSQVSKHSASQLKLYNKLVF